MTTRTLKSIAARLPESWQAELERLYFGRQIARGTFVATEHEFARLPELLAPGDWAIDVGANVGHYTKRMSDLVGPSGRVLAFEPVPATFELLAANVGRFRHANVSLFNAAVSSGLQVLGMSLPRFDCGLTNYYEAQLTPDGGAMRVLTMSLDSLQIGPPIRLVKIDAEGHEEAVISGMVKLIERHRPTLIVETWSEPVGELLRDRGYRCERAEGSSNLLCMPGERR